MSSVTKFMQMVLSCGLLGAVLVTFIAPSVSRLMISAPVSFGMNCEPAADWSMQALIKSQTIGLVLGMLVGIGGAVYFKTRQRRTETPRPAAPRPVI